MTADRSQELDEAKRLVRLAFDAARRGGKADWFEMKTSVLKNRLLQLTHGEFAEATYGGQTFREFVGMLDDTLEVSPKDPGVVVLKDYLTLATDSPSRTRSRIRRDLWSAVMDYSQPGLWVWTSERGEAELTTSEDDPRPVLPTITPDDFADWRNAFAGTLTARSLTEVERQSVEAWRVRGLPTAALPAGLRGGWNGFVSDRVAQRLTDWFHAQGLQVPVDIYTDQPTPRAELERESLRAFVVRCVTAMTAEELRSVEIPAAVAHRVARDGS